MKKDDLPYICQLLSNMSSMPTRVYQGQKQIYFYSRTPFPIDPISLVLDDILAIQQHVGYYITEDFFYYGFVRLEDCCLILGPSRHAALSDQELRKIAFDLSITPENMDDFLMSMRSIINMPLDAIMQIMCSFNFLCHEEKLMPSDIVIFEENQKDLYQILTEEEMNYENYLQPSEPQQEDILTNYQIEQTLSNMVRHGDLDAFHQWAKHAPSIRPGKTSQNSLRQQKNVCIISATLTSRAAIRGGMPIDDAMRLSDSYIQKAERLNNFEQLTNLQFHMVENFTREVEMIKYAGNDSELVKKVTTYVRHHLSDAIKTEDIAEELFISRSHLSTKFHEETGQTLNDYIRMMKMSEAKHLLTNTEKNLLAISTYLGFSSQSHFCRVFKKETGMSPKEYRNQNQ